MENDIRNREKGNGQTPSLSLQGHHVNLYKKKKRKEAVKSHVCWCFGILNKNSKCLGRQLFSKVKVTDSLVALFFFSFLAIKLWNKLPAINLRTLNLISYFYLFIWLPELDLLHEAHGLKSEHYYSFMY